MTEHAKSFEATDPFALVGVTYQVASGDEADRAMALVFIEEYALMGWDAGRIRDMFGSPLYGGPHGILRRRGLPFVQELIDAVLSPRVR